MNKICFLSIDVEPDFGKEGFRGVEKLDKILDIFEKYHVPATLFVTGQALQKYSQAAKQWSKHYEIACHGFSHTFWSQLSGEQRKQELEQFNVVYRNMFGQQAKGFRGPSHIIDEPGLQLLQEQGFLYDSSVVPHYPFFKKYRGYEHRPRFARHYVLKNPRFLIFSDTGEHSVPPTPFSLVSEFQSKIEIPIQQGRAPLSPYCPADDNLRKKGSPSQLFSEKLGGQEMKILEIPVTGQVLGLPLAGAWIAKLPLFVYKVLFAVDQPAFLTFNLHSWDALNPQVLVKTDKFLSLLKKKNYQFLSGEEILKAQGSRLKAQGNDTKFKIIDNANEWQELLNRALFKTFFHSLDWENFLEHQFKWLKFERYLYEDSLLLSLARCKIGEKEKLISHPFCEYGGPLPLKKDIDFQQFKKALFSQFQTDFSINFHPKALNYFSNIRINSAPSPLTPLPQSPLAGKGKCQLAAGQLTDGLKREEVGYLPSPLGRGDKEGWGIDWPAPVRRATYLIEDLGQKTKEELWTSLRKTLRQAIKKAQEAGLILKEPQDEKELKKFYKLYLKTGKRNKILAYPFSFFSYFWHRPNSEIILAKYQGKIIAGSVFLLQRGFVHYFLNASNRRYKDLYPNHLILWHQIVKYLGREERTLDLGGTRIGSSLAIFKSGWGAKKYPIFELNQGPTQEKLRHSSLRKIWGLLPAFAIRALSPWLLRYKI